MGRYFGAAKAAISKAKVDSLMKKRYPPGRKLNILQMSASPVAGVPYLLKDLFNKYTEHESKTMTGMNGYRDGRRWERPDANIASMGDAAKLVIWADVIIMHNGARHRNTARLRKTMLGKHLIPYYHSEPHRVDRSWEKMGAKAYVIAQGHALLYPGMAMLPNVIDIYDQRHLPPKTRSDPAKKLLVAFCPSNSISHKDLCKSKLPYSSKGMPETAAAINRLNKSGVVQVDTIRGVPFDNCMEMRKKYHVVIDEVVTGSYHRSALEAMSHGQLPITAINAKVQGFVRKMSGGGVAPWYQATPETLYDRIMTLQKDPEILKDLMALCRPWMEDYWNPKDLMEKYWLPAVEGRNG